MRRSRAVVFCGLYRSQSGSGLLVVGRRHLAADARTRELDLYLLAQKFHLVHGPQGRVCVANIVELDEFVMLLVRRLTDFLNVSPPAERGADFVGAGGGVYVEDDECALVGVRQGRLVGSAGPRHGGAVVLEEAELHVDGFAEEQRAVDAFHRGARVAQVIKRDDHGLDFVRDRRGELRKLAQRPKRVEKLAQRHDGLDGQIRHDQVSGGVGANRDGRREADRGQRGALGRLGAGGQRGAGCDCVHAYGAADGVGQ
mmetsp:Transcript_13691/g.34914  ORF Transcript_13691/g.34914 Transcript_13691/m.34914 type:complete len:256 (+) Transcript_13691:1993-2760(+)